MKGLLIKDFVYIKNQRVFLLILAAISVYFFVSGQNLFFVVTYVSAMFATLIVNTVSFDEQDGGMGFLFTLPISRKAYVLEKYVFGILMAFAMVLFGGIFLFVAAVIKEPLYDMQEIVTLFACALLVPVFLLSVMLPVMLKFGTEKSRAAMFLVLGIFILIGYGIKQAQNVLGVDILEQIERLVQGNAFFGIAAVLAGAAAMFLASFALSMAAINRKQF